MDELTPTCVDINTDLNTCFTAVFDWLMIAQLFYGYNNTVTTCNHFILLFHYMWKKLPCKHCDHCAKPLSD